MSELSKDTNRDVALTYYTNRVAKMEDVIKLRENSPCSPNDLHAITGYDYLSISEWDSMCEELIWKESESILFPKLKENQNENEKYSPFVLDCGCGSGAVLDFIIRKYNKENEKRGNIQGKINAFGFDLTQSLVDIAKSRIPSASIWCGDITSNESYELIKDLKFNLITCYGVFIHLNTHHDARLALSNFNKYLNRDEPSICFIGYIMDAYNEKEAEKSRSNSTRKQQFIQLLSVVPTYLYCNGELFREWQNNEGNITLWHTTMKQQLGEHDLFRDEKFPNSFRGRCSVYFRPKEQMQ